MLGSNASRLRWMLKLSRRGEELKLSCRDSSKRGRRVENAESGLQLSKWQLKQLKSNYQNRTMMRIISNRKHRREQKRRNEQLQRHRHSFSKRQKQQQTTRGSGNSKQWKRKLKQQHWLSKRGWKRSD